MSFAGYVNLKRLTFAVISIFAGTVVGLILVEFVVRVVGIRPAVMDASMYVANPDRLLPYKLRPNYQDQFAGGRITIDSSGRRRMVPTDSYGQELQPGTSFTNRVLLLGDSAVFGLGLDDDQTIASRLASLFVKNKIASNVDSIGVAGYTSWNEYAAFKQYEHIDQTSVVVLIYVANDLTYDNDTLKISNGQMAIVSNSRTHQFLRWLYSNVYVAYVLADTVKRMGGQSGMGVPDYVKVDDGALQYSFQALRMIMETCEQKNIKFLVALYREVLIFSEREAEERYERIMSRAFEEAKIPFFVLREHTDRLTLNEAKVAWNDSHPSPAAADLLAQQIYRELNSRGLLRTAAQ
jgi:hypothetical protein